MDGEFGAGLRLRGEAPGVRQNRRERFWTPAGRPRRTALAVRRGAAQGCAAQSFQARHLQTPAGQRLAGVFSF